MIHSGLGSFLDGPFELSSSVGFLLLLGGALGWLSRRQSLDRAEMGEAIQQLHQMRKALQQSEKIAMLGRLTSRIAHEINNPISAILTRLDCMLNDARDEGRGDSEVEDLRVLLRQTHRLADISGKLLRFARPISAAAEGVDVNACIERAVQCVEHRLPDAELTLNLNLSLNLPRIHGSASALEEVVLNLLTNAIDACPRNGQIYIISALSGGREKALQVFVADTGGGIRPEDLEQVFEPFFTTKGPGAGTGLGLFIAHEIVREHCGTIEVETELGKGTTFVINLPVPSE
jgi:signal transduction histidine kinase